MCNDGHGNPEENSESPQYYRLNELLDMISYLHINILYSRFKDSFELRQRQQFLDIKSV